MCLAGRLHHDRDTGDLVEQAWKASEPFVVEPAHADVHPQVIFSSKHWRRSRRLGKNCRLALVRSTSNEAHLWEPTAPHQQIDSNSLLHVRDGLLNVCIPDDSNVCACCQIKVVHPSCSYEALILGFHRELLISPPWPPHGGHQTNFSIRFIQFPCRNSVCS